ncbi:DUF967 domain-containing protein [Colletotrichum tofieldiae]|uniref:DUF967 domain-containing protein n=2 Tax=Colletotrichum spaethianum species complex TaxID=2707349 RepID=A0A166PNN8_9PEZI|nr:DUF967 domain-containing protein [Colletotrichum tofieldiae]
MPPGRPRLDLEPYKDEIIEAFNRRETVESMIKGLAAKGVEVNGKTFQRRLREWGLYRYAKTPKKQNNTVRTSTVGSAPMSVTASVTQTVLQPITQQEEIPDSLNDESLSSGGSVASPSPEEAIRNPNKPAVHSYLNSLRPPSPPRPNMSQKVWTRRNPAGFGLEKSLEAVRSPDAAPVNIPSPSRDVEALKEDGDSFILSSFTYEDAFELGHLLHARLLPFALKNGKPTVISIALANNQQILFQTAVGPGTLPDNETWVQRKRNSVLRWGCSTWLLHNKLGGDEQLFASKFGMSTEQAGKYAIHGGGVPIRVKGVEGVVAVVVVSGLKQDEDHGVIVDVIKNNWQ